MKKVKTCFILLLLFGFASVFAQAIRSETPVKNPVEANSRIDPKLSPEEQALILTAGEDNPEKIDQSAMVDPKLNPEYLPTEEDYGVSNANPAEENSIDPKLESGQVPKVKQAEPDPASKAVSGRSQPAGENGGTIPNYRNMSGSGNDQPRGEEPKNIPDYRENHGSGNHQPEGDPPDK